jgi:hypothetical protein
VSPTVGLTILDDACATDTAFVLTGGTPIGGVYTGTGVDSVNGTFDAKTMGLGEYLVTYTYVDTTTGCTAFAQDSLTVENCYRPYCSYTQGFWGNGNGKANTCDSTNGLNTEQLLSLILKDTSVVIGDYATSCSDNWRSFTIYQKDTLNILAVLPGGGPSKQLDKVNGKCNGTDWTTKYNTLFTSTSSGAMSPMITTKKRMPNVANTLLAQTMALSFNTLYDSDLSSLVLEGDTIHTQKSLNCDSGRYTPAGSAQKDVLPSSLRAYYSGDYSVAQLLELANNALSGKYVPSGSDPSLSELTQATATINEAFDECRLLTGFTSPISLKKGNQITANVSSFEKAGYKVSTYPNPFNEMFYIELESQYAANAGIEIYDVRGRLVSSFGENCIPGDNRYSVDTKLFAEGMYIVKVRVGDAETNVKLLKINK